jgi:hypothetical protein
MFSDSWVFRFLAEAIFEDNSLDLAEGAFADNSLDLLNDTNRNLQPDDVVRMLRRNTPKEGRDLYEFIAFLTWYGSLLICCIIPAICACRRRRRAMIERLYSRWQRYHDNGHKGECKTTSGDPRRTKRERTNGESCTVNQIYYHGTLYLYLNLYLYLSLSAMISLYSLYSFY